MCRSRRELSNEYLLAKVGVDTAENEPLEVWGKIFNIFHWCPYSLADSAALGDVRDRYIVRKRRLEEDREIYYSSMQKARNNTSMVE